MRIEIKVWPESEDVSPLDQQAACQFYDGFADDVRKTIKQARKLDPESLWGWCQVTVEARAYLDGGREVAGRSYLSGCSYLSQADFCHPEGYYPDMVKDAIADLFRRLKQHSPRVTNN